MAEKDANKSNSFERQNEKENEELNSLLSVESGDVENRFLASASYLSSYGSPQKKEENPFSFKKFLNQDSSSEKNKGARKKVYPTATISAVESELPNHNSSCDNHDEVNSRISSSDLSSVLPDFVQDHLVIEQCYLNNSSAINIDNINLRNLPDLNLEHQNVNSLSNSNDFNQYSRKSVKQFCTNLPDFTVGVSSNQSGIHNSLNHSELPDFTLSARTNSALNIECANENNASFVNGTSRRRISDNDDKESNHISRQRAQISSPSVPLDLPSYENNESNHNVTIPFDLTAPAEENNCTSRGAPAPDGISKSLPDFLSDGPIKKELDENFKNNRSNTSSLTNGFLFTETPMCRLELEREIDILRCQVSEKNRRLGLLESELAYFQTTDQREIRVKYAFKEVKKQLKVAMKRAQDAEEQVLKLKQENTLLRNKLSTLMSENMEFKLKYCDDPQIPGPSQGSRQQQIARELKAAANVAETSLRSLLNGIDNLRMIASSLENINNFQDESHDESFSQEDSASGSAL